MLFLILHIEIPNEFGGRDEFDDFGEKGGVHLGRFAFRNPLRKPFFGMNKRFNIDKIMEGCGEEFQVGNKLGFDILSCELHRGT